MSINKNEHLSTSVRTCVHGITTKASNDDRQTGMPRLSHLMTEIDNHLLTSSIGVPINSTRTLQIYAYRVKSVRVSIPVVKASLDAYAIKPEGIVESYSPFFFTILIMARGMCLMKFDSFLDVDDSMQLNQSELGHFIVLCATPYSIHFRRMGFFDAAEFDKWVQKAVAPPIKSSLKLYEEVLKLGFKIVLLIGRS
ncbi:Acid phosphatase, class B-like [Dillenia turbinata]|uniref:Acid phosphatase, class B-like n=1 Tax=Dillenia turbinata TaxID=194707 RepID=A0AAN8V3N6_9MAGN